MTWGRRFTEDDLKAMQSRGQPRADTPVRKFRNTPTVVDGEQCASKKEAAHYLLLKDRQATGKIRNLVLHGRVVLKVNGMEICEFEPDLMWEEPVDGAWRLHAADVKGMKKGVVWRHFLVKARLFEAVHKTRVEVL